MCTSLKREIWSQNITQTVQIVFIYLGIYTYININICVCMCVCNNAYTLFKDKEVMSLGESQERESTWKGMKGRKGREKLCNYIKT